MIAQQSFEQAMKRVRGLEDDLKAIHSACLKLAKEKALKFTSGNLISEALEIISLG